MKEILANLDRGFYKTAKTLPEGPRSSFGYLSDLAAEKGIVLTPDELQGRVKRLCQALNLRRSLDSLTDYHRGVIEQFAADTYGLDKALAECGIRVKGASIDRLEKFFATTTSTILFPTYVEAQIVMGILATSILGDLVATETPIDAHVYEPLAFTDTEADQQLRIMGEGGEIPTTSVATADRSIRLKKFGRMLEATYESLRLQRVNVVALMLQRIGQRIALDECNEAIETLIAGDGNTGSAVTDTEADVSGTLDYDELVKLDLAFTDGYTMSAAVTNATLMRTILNMAEFKDPMAGFSFQRTGALPGPMGANWHVWRSTNSSSFSTDRILAVDSRMALEQVTEGGVLVESDKLINKQIERTAVTKWTGFAKMDYAATQCLDVTA